MKLYDELLYRFNWGFNDHLQIFSVFNLAYIYLFLMICMDRKIFLLIQASVEISTTCDNLSLLTCMKQRISASCLVIFALKFFIAVWFLWLCFFPLLYQIILGKRSSAIILVERFYRIVIYICTLLWLQIVWLILYECEC